jgi:hypothetical protein
LLFPAYVRRYPFVFYATEDADHYVLGIDATSDRLAKGGETGVALFNDQAASPVTTEALHFCEAFRRDIAVTRKFADDLGEHELLVSQQASVTLTNGVSFDIDGFQVVDEKRLSGIDDATIGNWHRRGWLALIHFHLASLDRF